MTGHSIFIMVFGALILFSGALLIWSLAHRYRRRLGVEKEAREKTTETAFIISAFHEVTKQLKEKEKELERLKLQAEQHAENVESYNENILQCVTSGVMTFDRSCLLTTINRAAEEVLGVKREQVIGKACRDLFLTGEISKTIQDTFETRMPSARMESPIDCPSGKRWLGYNTVVLTDRRGEAIGVIFSFSDLTQVKQLQEQMELRERLTALGEMSAGIAHELRNPMAVISGYLNLLSKKMGTEHQNIIRDITNEVSGMNRIIGDLLTFARPASLNRVKVNIHEMLENCLVAALQATGAGSRITTDLKLDDVEADVDEVLMKQAFTNLIQNAIEAMPDGGTLTIATEKKRELKISICDTGIGIPPENIKRIFLPFYTTKEKGTGLGLALVHKIVLSHGGRIAVESSEGKGAAFRVILPVR